MAFFRISVLLVSALFASAVYAIKPVESPNLLTNPNFENGLLLWEASASGAVTWISNYELGPPGDTGIGAAVVFPRTQDDTSLAQCVSVEPSAISYASTWLLQTCANNANLGVQWFTTPNCDLTIGDVGGTSVISGSTTHGWLFLTLTAESPTSAQSALVKLENHHACEEGVVFDQVFFGDHIFNNSFD